MKIKDICFFTGRNIYSHRPVMRLRLDPEQWRSFRTNEHPFFVEKLVELLPGLSDHYCSRGRPGGFLERLIEGTYLGHVIEHVCLDLQQQAGVGTDYGKTMSAKGGLVDIICEYRCRQAADLLGRTAVAVVNSLLAGSEPDFKEAVSLAKRLAAEHLPGPSTAAILAAAHKRGIPVQHLAEGASLYRLGSGIYQRRISASISDTTACIAVDIAGNKQLTKKLLREHGLPVPCGEVVYSLDKALAAAQELGYPVVMKPDNGNQGKGVSLNINSEAEVETAFARAAQYSSGVMVEKFLPGRNYRLLIVDNTLVAASERIPAHVIGDGQSTILELIAQANSNPLRGEGHEKPLTRVTVDEITGTVLAKQGLSLGSVPLRSRLVWLRESANLSTGGIAYDVTDKVHPLQAELAVRAAQIIGLDISGVDLVMDDISTPPMIQCGGIIEINAAPGLRMHLFPTEGKKRDVGQKIVDMLFPAGKPCRIPLFSVTGTNGKTTTTRMLEYVLRKNGFFTGMCCTDGIYINGTKVRQGDLTGPTGAGNVLGHPQVEVAVLETARGGIVRRGLGYDKADVAVITNIRADHLGQDDIETMDDLFHVKSLVAEAVYASGTVVLNADDPYVCDLTARAWSDIIYTSTQNENIIVRRHLGKDGRAVFIRRGTIIAAQGYRAVIVGRVRDFAVTIGGKATHQVENLLSALAACWGYGITPRQAGFYLRKFAVNPEDNPGRANLFDLGYCRVLVDYGHNADGIGKTGELARKLRPQRSIAVVGVPGDRSDELVIEAGKAAGLYFDYLYIKEDSDLRGRIPGETASLLAQGAACVGFDRQKIVMAENEQAAVRAALGSASRGDLIVIFYEKLEPLMSELVQFRPALTAETKAHV
ncbi:MAG: cyanophycin synthetase [Dethiobacter sp.]|jgi:cyanophycin synthetase|nr:cyanophycin synthetase [Dethiobacter sp.]MBS4023915.1 cyanophycin synthetase [Dethiobacter sp.]